MCMYFHEGLLTVVFLSVSVIDGSSADPASDWSAPAEVWGNYEEPEPEAPAPPPEQPASTPLTNTTEDAQVGRLGPQRHDTSGPVPKPQ